MLLNAKDVKKEKREIKFKTHKKSFAQIINKESFQKFELFQMSRQQFYKTFRILLKIGIKHVNSLLRKNIYLFMYTFVAI